MYCRYLKQPCLSTVKRIQLYRYTHVQINVVLRVSKEFWILHNIELLDSMLKWAYCYTVGFSRWAWDFTSNVFIVTVNPSSDMESPHIFTLCMDLGSYLRDLLGEGALYVYVYMYM